MLRCRYGYAIVGAFLGLFLAGCGPKYSTIPVKGTLTCDGQPVADVIVQFAPAEGRASSGTTQADGSFEMVYTMDQKGVEPGQHKVTVSWSPADDSDSAPPELVQKVLDDFKANGPIEATVDSAQDNFEIKLPR
jgi:hypothetical protein